MSSTEFETAETYRDDDGNIKHVWMSKPDYAHSLPGEFAEFIGEASKLLTEFRKQWMEGRTSWGSEVEFDNVPIFTGGMVAGFMVISEADGESYDFAPAKQVLQKADGKEE